MQTIRVLAISGSLRAASINTAMLTAAAAVAPAGIDVVPFAHLGEFPLFNPDTEYPLPPPVQAFREQLNAADAVLIASPEYAHGVTGVIKNALDWVVGCEAFVHKPTAVLNASPRAVHADAALKETLSVMSADLVPEASVTLRVLGSGLDALGIARHSVLAATLRDALDALRQYVLDRRHEMNHLVD
ncbi:NADPH-dependent FMN reductase [Ralstonia insidiosa]|uniref:NAD(P)H-dependent oxidoreductase n=1 Tax=Ralstonia insidiosa TaxID=190721 RepID=A0A848NYV7_9RALS|nr:NADPH-dependent FMN reductase [Ralstonia insidiosa]NMV38133.1 NAD(P)H-dependent oxidoreductase [Ralstonia insidiosa]